MKGVCGVDQEFSKRGPSQEVLGQKSSTVQEFGDEIPQKLKTKCEISVHS